MRLDDSKADGIYEGGDLLVKALQSLPAALKAETRAVAAGEGGRRCGGGRIPPSISATLAAIG